MITIGSEVEELKKKLKEAKKSERLEKKEKRKQAQAARKNTREQKIEEDKKRRQQKKDAILLEKDNKKRERKEFHEQENEERSLRKKLVVDSENSQETERKEKNESPVEVEATDSFVGPEAEDLLPVTWASSYLPIAQIRNGIIKTRDERYVKIVEVLPINFLLRSASEKCSIVQAFASYLKIAPPKLQFKVLSKKADMKEYIEKIRKETEAETNERCRLLQEDYVRLLQELGTREAITRRFFLIFQYPLSGTKVADIKGLFGQRLWFYRKTIGYTDKLKISDACIGCGVYSKVCPMKNIEMNKNRAVPRERCTMCYRCISLCPQKAITLLGEKVQEQCRFEKYE